MKIHLLFACLWLSSSVLAQNISIPVQEKHFRTLTQLTFGGNNAEAYFSPDSKMLSFQSDYSRWGVSCDQIFYMPVNKKDTLRPPLISTGKGRTTCAYFLPGNRNILYASTHLGGDSCPPPPVMTPQLAKKYLWSVYKTYDIFVADLKGKIIRRLTDSPGYDAEATVSPDGKKIVFTSTRNGDLDLYVMDTDGKNVKQITSTPGYDGGAFFSPDSKKLVFRASRPQTEAELKDYKDLLAMGLVAPTQMEIFTCNADGSDQKQITHLGKANWAPFFHPSGKKILFSSNHASDRGYSFQIYMVNADGSGLEAVTSESNFNAFPMFSPDGKKLVFSSNRNNGGTRDTNVFIADWQE
jgi:TolB protein